MPGPEPSSQHGARMSQKTKFSICGERCGAVFARPSCQLPRIIPLAPKIHAKDLPALRLIVQFSRNTVSTMPNYTFDVMISHRRVLGLEQLSADVQSGRAGAVAH